LASLIRKGFPDVKLSKAAPMCPLLLAALRNWPCLHEIDWRG
jgi:hypothetical protein